MGRMCVTLSVGTPSNVCVPANVIMTDTMVVYKDESI